MAKNYRGGKFQDLDKKFVEIRRDITSKMATKRGISSIDSVEAWEKVGIRSVPGSNFENKSIERFAAMYRVSPDRALSFLLGSFSKYDPDVKDGKISKYAKSANVTTNALNAAGIRGDFRTFDALLDGMEKLYTRVEKGDIRPDKVFGALSAMGYAKQTFDKYASRFEFLKQYQTKAGFQIKVGDQSIYSRLWSRLGVPVEQVNQILSGQTVPTQILTEGSLYRSSHKVFDLTKTDIGRMHLNGLASVGYVANQLVSTALAGELNRQLSLQMQTEPQKANVLQNYPSMQQVTHRPLVVDRPYSETEGVQSFDFSASLSDQEEQALMEIVAINGEKSYEEVQARVAMVAQTINSQINCMINGHIDEKTKLPKNDGIVKEDGTLDLSTFSKEFRDYIELSTEFTNNDERVAFIRDVLTARCSEAAQKGALALNNEADIAFALAQATSSSISEAFEIPVLEADGTPKIEDGQIVYENASIFSDEKSRYALQYEGLTLFYEGVVNIPISEKDFISIRSELQDKYGKVITDLDLSSVTQESFKKCDPLTLGFADANNDAIVKQATEEEQLNATKASKPEEEQPSQPQTTKTTEYTPLFRDLTLYKQYVAEFKQLLEKSGLKFVVQNPDNSHITGPVQGDEDQDAGVIDTPKESPAPTPLSKTPEEIRSEIKQQVKGSSQIVRQEDGTIVSGGNFALLQIKLAKGLGVDPSQITGQTMIAAVARIRSWDNVKASDCLESFCEEFGNSYKSQGKYTSRETYLAQYTHDIREQSVKQNSAAANVVGEIEEFVEDYKQSFTQEELNVQLAKDPLSQFASEEEIERQRYFVGAGLNKEAIEYAAAEQLVVLMKSENQGLTSGQIPSANLPKIPTLEQSAGAVPEAGAGMEQQ